MPVAWTKKRNSRTCRRLALQEREAHLAARENTVEDEEKDEKLTIQYLVLDPPRRDLPETYSMAMAMKAFVDRQKVQNGPKMKDFLVCCRDLLFFIPMVQELSARYLDKWRKSGRTVVTVDDDKVVYHDELPSSSHHEGADLCKLGHYGQAQRKGWKRSQI